MRCDAFKEAEERWSFCSESDQGPSNDQGEANFPQPTCFPNQPCSHDLRVLLNATDQYLTMKVILGRILLALATQGAYLTASGSLLDGLPTR